MTFWTRTTVLLSLAIGCASAAAADEDSAPLVFSRDIRPILADKCYACHGPDSGTRKADLRLDREDVAKADPECGIAYWGIALSLLNNPHAPPPVGNLPLGLAAVEKGKAVGANAWPQGRINAEIVTAARMGLAVVRLKSGDPSLFGRAEEEKAICDQRVVEQREQPLLQLALQVDHQIAAQDQIERGNAVKIAPSPTVPLPCVSGGGLGRGQV